MKKISWIALTLALGTAGWAAKPEGTAYPLQLALVSPVALMQPEYSIRGLRLNMHLQLVP